MSVSLDGVDVYDLGPIARQDFPLNIARLIQAVIQSVGIVFAFLATLGLALAAFSHGPYFPLFVLITVFIGTTLFAYYFTTPAVVPKLEEAKDKV